MDSQEAVVMRSKQILPGTLLTLVALAIVYGVGTTFLSIELERLVERFITPRLAASPEVEAMSREIFTGIDLFMASSSVRVVGYTCFALALGLAMVGLLAGKRALARMGSVGFILPIYAYFLLHMSFLAGLSVLSALWSPFWGDIVRLGDIAYSPYMAVVYPASLLGLDLRMALTDAATTVGLLIFVLGVLAWFYARLEGKGTADFWIYRFTRHPQYLGWIIWSYGLMLRVALRRDTPLRQSNPGASLPWVISTMIIVCVALSEESHMQLEQGEDYESYQRRAPFMLPLPRFLNRLIAAPMRVVLGKDQPETGWELLLTFVVYGALVAALSLPFLVFAWPNGGSWATWPF
jgi:protein-S-isoprenylcysteine O-methyltransferase Ste14